MSRPHKVICEVTAETLSVAVLDLDSKEMFRVERTMESRGVELCETSDVLDCVALTDYRELAEEVDDMEMALFDIADKLLVIKEIDGDPASA